MPMTAPNGLRTTARMRLLRQHISRLHNHNTFILQLSPRKLSSSSTTFTVSATSKRTLTNSASHSSPPTTTTTSNISSASPQAIPLPATAPTVPIWQRLGPLTWAIQGFGRSQRKRPYLTQFISTLVIYFLGDMSAQAIRMSDERTKAHEAREKGEVPEVEGRYEGERTVKALVIGAGSSIPTYLWFIHLSTHYNYPSLLLSLATKVGINQLLYTPLFNSYFFGMQSILTFVPFLNRSPTSPNHDPRQLLTKEGWIHVRDHVAKTVPTSFVNSCKLWPAVTAINFWVVPVDFRAVTAGIVAVGWQTYLSFLNRRVEREEEKEELELDHAMEVLEKQGLSSGLVAGGKDGRDRDEKK